MPLEPNRDSPKRLDLVFEVSQSSIYRSYCFSRLIHMVIKIDRYFAPPANHGIP